MAGLIDQVVGHRANLNWLLEQAQKGELPSSLIFQGPQGIGKKFLALSLLQVLNCSESDRACGVCSNCKRALEDKNELVYVLEPEGKKTIGVDQVREIHSFLNLKSLRPARFIIIDPADKLSIPAANSLLKVLEESPEKTYFILVTEKMRGLLPTIRSRSHILKFEPLSKDELQSYKTFEPMALNWSDGRLQMALELEEEKKQDQLNESLRFFYSLLCEGPQDWKKNAPWFFASDDSREFTFNIWKQALEKRLYATGENLDWMPEDRSQITRVYDGVESMKSDMHANVDKVLAVENFYYRLHSTES